MPILSFFAPFLFPILALLFSKKEEPEPEPPAPAIPIRKNEIVPALPQRKIVFLQMEEVLKAA